MTPNEPYTELFLEVVAGGQLKEAEECAAEFERHLTQEEV